MRRSFLLRIPLMAAALLTLLAALGGGLARLGWGLPAPTLRWNSFHGPLMVGGFLGTLIALEKAAALDKTWTYAAPLLSVAGALSLLLGFPVLAGKILLSAGSFFLVAVFGFLCRRQPALFTFTMGLGALCLLVGNLLWTAGWPIFWLALWWAGFPILVIAGERLELARILHLPTKSRILFIGATGIFSAGLVAETVFFEAGVRTAGIGMIFLAGWLAMHDMALRTVRQPGLPRFMAVCLMTGYFWLAVAGGIAILFPGMPPGSAYDAILHCLFLGFTFSMIFGHAPVIFPAVLGLQIPFRRRFYAPLLLLHATLVLRVAADLAHSHAGRQWSGLLNALTLIFFLANTVSAAIISLPARKRPTRSW